MFKLVTRLRERQNEEAFTVLELIIVVLVIGVLAAVAIPIFFKQQQLAIKAGVKEDVRRLHVATLTYLARNPTATNLQWRLDATGAESGALILDPYWMQLRKGLNPSQNTTILALRGDGEVGSIGSWQQYYILGANITDTPREENQDYYRFYFDSTTGKYSSNDGI